MTTKTRAHQPRYTARVAPSGALIITKWDTSGGKTNYWVRGEGVHASCACPHFHFQHTCCKHIRLSNLLASGRLEDGAAYVWDGDQWHAASRRGKGVA